MNGTKRGLSSAHAVVAALVAAALVAGCQGGGGNVMQTDTGKGALFGGAGGAIIGGLIDHADPAVGMLIGAAGGALVGGLVGHHMDTQRQNPQSTYEDGRAQLMIYPVVGG